MFDVGIGYMLNVNGYSWFGFDGGVVGLNKWGFRG